MKDSSYRAALPLSTLGLNGGSAFYSVQSANPLMTKKMIEITAYDIAHANPFPAPINRPPALRRENIGQPMRVISPADTNNVTIMFI
jgi:hypothetical protein